MRILVATGSFKDVFSPLEAAKIISEALDHRKNEVWSIPFCDGGEYTYEVLRHCFPYDEIPVEHVVNPYGKECTCCYLTGGKEAHIVSSSVLRLFPEEDRYKNPLKLTDYGYGQMILDALKRGYTDLTLYFGGTSTVAGGMGAIQAIGAELYDENGDLISELCRGEDLARISKIEVPGSLLSQMKNIRVHIVADGNSKVDALPGITGLKVGKEFSMEKETIVAKSMKGIENILDLTGIPADQDFTGAAGGLLFGLEQIFPSVRYTLGGLYFNDILEVENQINRADLVITGEGRYDNTADGKAPSVISALAKKHGKPTMLVCGQVDKTRIPDYSGGVVNMTGNAQFSEQGITAVLTCQEFYDSVVMPDTYAECIKMYREKTPVLIRRLFQKAGL